MDFGSVQSQSIFMTPEEIAIARERGRSTAAQAIICNPESRRRVEERFGLEYCKQRYPEAYGRMQ